MFGCSLLAKHSQVSIPIRCRGKLSSAFEHFRHNRNSSEVICCLLAALSLIANVSKILSPTRWSKEIWWLAFIGSYYELICLRTNLSSSTVTTLRRAGSVIVPRTLGFFPCLSFQTSDKLAIRHIARTMRSLVKQLPPFPYWRKIHY